MLEAGAMKRSSNVVDGLTVVDGSLRDFAQDPVACMTELQRDFGNLVALKEGGQQVVFAFGAEYNRELLSQADLFHSRFFAVRGPKNSAQRRLTSGLLSQNGAEHTQQRRIVKSAFSKHAISGYRDVVQQLTTEMLSDWQVGQVKDIAAEMTRLMLRITSSILFGMKRPELAFELGELIHQWVDINHEIGPSVFISEADSYNRYEQLLAASKEVESRVRQLLSDRRQSAAADSDMLSLLIQAHVAGEGISEDQLIGQTALLFAAAHMTTAHSMLWTLLLIAQHPDIADRLDSELAELTEITDDGTLQAAPLLLDRVLRESMRVLPASAYSQRIAQTDVTFANAKLPIGSIVIFSQFMTHRLEAVYAQPKRFLPDRWLSIKPSPYEYLPFGGGPRLCLGSTLAMSIMRSVLPAILRRFRLSALSHSEINALVVSTMLGPTTTVPLQLLAPGSTTSTATLRGNLPSLVEFPSEAQRVMRAA